MANAKMSAALIAAATMAMCFEVKMKNESRIGSIPANGLNWRTRDSAYNRFMNPNYVPKKKRGKKKR
jgi:hypothetical protein